MDLREPVAAAAFQDAPQGPPGAAASGTLIEYPPPRLPSRTRRRSRQEPPPAVPSSNTRPRGQEPAAGQCVGLAAFLGAPQSPGLGSRRARADRCRSCRADLRDPGAAAAPAARISGILARCRSHRNRQEHDPGARQGFPLSMPRAADLRAAQTPRGRPDAAPSRRARLIDAAAALISRSRSPRLPPGHAAGADNGAPLNTRPACPNRTHGAGRKESYLYAETKRTTEKGCGARRFRCTAAGVPRWLHNGAAGRRRA